MGTKRSPLLPKKPKAKKEAKKTIRETICAKLQILTK